MSTCCLPCILQRKCLAAGLDHFNPCPLVPSAFQYGPGSLPHYTIVMSIFGDVTWRRVGNILPRPKALYDYFDSRPLTLAITPNREYISFGGTQLSVQFYMARRWFSLGQNVGGARDRATEPVA